MDLSAGKWVDKLIAEKVFGWKWHEIKIVYEHGFLLGPKTKETISVKTVLLPPDFLFPKATLGINILEIDIPNYSEDISSAWKVIEKMRGCVPLKLWYDDTMMEWCCQMNEATSVAETVPLAICLAALKVCEK